jgi:hypothetical protein
MMALEPGLSWLAGRGAIHLKGEYGMSRLIRSSILAGVVCSGLMLGQELQADSTLFLVQMSSSPHHDQIQAEVSGGTSVAGKVVPGRPDLSTPSFITPLVIKTPKASRPLLKEAVTSLLNPSNGSLEISALECKHTADRKLSVVGNTAYGRVVVNRIDIPGPSGSPAPFIVTSSAGTVKSDPVPAGTIIPDPSSAWTAGGPPPPGNEPVNNFEIRLDDWENVGPKTKGSDAKTTFDGFALLPTTQTDGLELTVHGTLAYTDIAKWTAAHPNGAHGSVGWILGTFGNAKPVFTINFDHATVVSSANDPPPKSATTPTTFTAHIKVQHVSLVFLF